MEGSMVYGPQVKEWEVQAVQQIWLLVSFWFRTGYLLDTAVTGSGSVWLALSSSGCGSVWLALRLLFRLLVWSGSGSAVQAGVQMRVYKLIVADSLETSDEEVKDKLATLKHKLEDPVLDDLVKDAATYGLQVISKANNDEAKIYGDLWPYTLKTTERDKVSRGRLCEAKNCIHETTGWSDLEDSLSVYAYIAKSEANEAWVEEKQNWDEEIAGSSKSATRSNDKREEVPKHTPKVNMEDALKDKKQGKPRGPSYKLKSDIELATDLKKVFEERILNSKVEMTLGDIFGIAKHEFHEEIIDIIKRKRQIPSEQELEGVKI
ncbi:hypothetical protein L7F22_057349 [Adiantum nelumboides]|nr:hypothetical protein [Adiantum nelumboides]